MISPELMDQAKGEGKTATFTCRAIGEQIPSILWYFNNSLVDENIITKYNVTRTLNATVLFSTLQVLNVRSSDVGTYTCIATV